MDVLLGCDYFGLHPKQGTRSGDHLSIMSGSLGICLQPDLAEGTKYDNILVKKIHDVSVKVETYKICVDSHSEFYQAWNANTYLTCLLMNGKYQREVDHAENFIQGKELETEVVPKCGGCCCNKCHIVALLSVTLILSNKSKN